MVGKLPSTTTMSFIQAVETQALQHCQLWDDSVPYLLLHARGGTSAGLVRVLRDVARCDGQRRARHGNMVGGASAASTACAAGPLLDDLGRGFRREQGLIYRLDWESHRRGVARYVLSVRSTTGLELSPDNMRTRTEGKAYESLSTLIRTLRDSQEPFDHTYLLDRPEKNYGNPHKGVDARAAYIKIATFHWHRRSVFRFCVRDAAVLGTDVFELHRVLSALHNGVGAFTRH